MGDDRAHSNDNGEIPERGRGGGKKEKDGGKSMRVNRRKKETATVGKVEGGTQKRDGEPLGGRARS